MRRRRTTTTTTTTQQQQPPPPPPPERIKTNDKEVLAVVCLQAQHVAGLPAAAEGRQVLLQQQPTATRGGGGAAAATCRGGVAFFHDQVLLLHCAPVSSIIAVAVAVTVRPDPEPLEERCTVNVNLAEQLRRPSPRVLSFVVGGAVLSLTLHHRRLIKQQRCACGVLLSCLRAVPPLGPIRPAAAAAAHHDDDDDNDDCFFKDKDKDKDSSGSSSAGFITIEKGTIYLSRSRRRPPSDNLVTTDDEVDDGKPIVSASSCFCLDDDDSKVVENEFLAMLDLGDDGDLLNLEALVEEAEAELDRSPQLAGRAGPRSVN